LEKLHISKIKPHFSGSGRKYQWGNNDPGLATVLGKALIQHLDNMPLAQVTQF